METFILDWSILPAMMYMPLDKFKKKEGREGFFYPCFGPGVYLFVYPSRAGYQVYYVGQAEEIGCRLTDHINSYMGKGKPYYLPTSIDYYNEDVYKYFRLEKCECKLSIETSDFTGNSYSTIGEEIIMNTWFCFAKIHKAEKAFREEVEGVLIKAVMKANKLPEVGWIGDGQLTLPKRDLEIINHYNGDTIRKIIGPTLPEKILYTREDGKVIFNY